MINFWRNYIHLGLLNLRLGTGIMFVFHGLPKMTGGQDRWERIGAAMSVFGIDFWYELWGFMAAFAELGGGILLIAGLFHIPACSLLFFTMIVATSRHLSNGDSLGEASHAIEAAILFLSLIFIGPGKLSLDYRLHKSKRKRTPSEEASLLHKLS